MKLIKKVTAVALLAAMLAGCSSSGGASQSASSTAASSAETSASTETSADSTDAAENVHIDKLTVAFVPSREPDEIITQTEPLKELLINELAPLGYDVDEVEITVGTTYEAVGEGLDAGTIDIGLIPGGTYVMYDSGCEVILAATRDGLSIDSDDPTVWNANAPTEGVAENQVTYYRALILAGPSAKGKELVEKVENGEELTWDDLNSANWSVMGPSSSAGYIYPTLWLINNYDGKTIPDLASALPADSYASSFARLATGQCDILVCYADARRDNADRWQEELGGENEIWEDVKVIGVTPGIFNDTVSVSKSSPIMDDDLKAALQTAFINIGNSEEGKAVIDIYQHKGYKVVTSEDYDNEREAQRIIRELND